MKYNLVITKEGLVPIQEIQEGQEVLSDGKWIKSPKPTKGKVITCSFESLPTTSFEKQFISGRKEVSVNHQPILNQHIKDKIGLRLRGFKNYETERSPNLQIKKSVVDLVGLNYWYSAIIDFYNTVTFPFYDDKDESYKFYDKVPKITELYGNELSKKNLECYLEGYLMKRFCIDDGYNFLINHKNLNESDRMMLRLLDIDFIVRKFDAKVVNPINLLKHVKNEYLKSKITEDMIVAAMKKSLEVPQYTPGYKILKRKEEEDWILEGVNPDINCINPIEYKYCNDIYKLTSRKLRISMDKIDSNGHKAKGKVIHNSLWNNFYN